MKEVISRKKGAHKAMYRNTTEDNKMRHKSTENKANKAHSKAMREKGEEVLTELKTCPCGMLRLVKGVNIDSKEGEGRCIRRSYGKVCFSEKARGKFGRVIRKG